MVETTDGPKQGKPTNDDSDSKKASSGLSKAVTQIGQSGLALLLIVPAFILIGYMLVMQDAAVKAAITGINTIAGIQTTPNTAASSNTSTSSTTSAPTTTSIDQSRTNAIREVSTFYQQINASNQNMFSIILTVFGTWVGAVVAFYFGTQNLRQSQESFNKVGQVLDNTISKIPQATQAPKVTYKTIGELLEKLYTAKEPAKVYMNDTIGEVKKKFAEHPTIDNLVVLDINEEDEPEIVGVLYKIDLTEEIEAKYEGTDLDDKKLKEVVTMIKTDSATSKPWNETGIDNYVILKEVDTVEAAKEKMNSKGNLPIRGIVTNDEDQPIGILNIQDLSSE